MGRQNDLVCILYNVLKIMSFNRTTVFLKNS